MAYTNNNGQIRVGVRSGISNSPIVQPAFSASLIQSLYGVWNGDTTTNELSTSIFGAWNGETPGTSLDSSIFAVYNADGDANDSKGTNHGTLVNGATFSTGKIGQSFQFDGTNDYLKLPNNSLNFTGDFSVSFWMKLGSLNQTSYIIDSAGFSGIGTTGWVLNLTSGNLNFTIHNNNTASSIAANYVLTSTSVWYHIVITSKSGYNAIYINNSLIMSNTSTMRPNYVSSPYSIPYIGVFKTVNTQFFNGNIDLLNIWSKELTTDEITQLYNSGNGAQYPYSSQSLPSPKDSVGTNHGTLMNGCSFTTGKIGNAFSFDGVNDYMELPANSMNLTGDFTISFWVYMRSRDTNIIMSNYGNDGINRGFYIDSDGSYALRFVGNYLAPYYSLIKTDNSALFDLNTWMHFTFISKNGIGQWYKNGVANGASGTVMTNGYITNNKPIIGGYRSGNNGAISYNKNMALDAFTIWNKAISQDEITQLYNLGSGVQYPFVGTLPSTMNQLGVDNGTLMNGASLSTGKIGQAFTFDGVNDYVQFPNNSLNFTGDFSVSAWVYVPTTLNGSSSIRIISNMSCDSWFSNPYGWEFLVYGNNLNFSIFNHTNTYYTIQVGYVFVQVSNVSPGGWYHLTATRKASTGTKLFINGNMVGSDSNTVNPTYNLTVDDIRPTIGNMYMGVNGSKQNSYYAPAGTKVDGLSVWQKELTQSEVTELYNSGNGKQITATPIVQSGLLFNLDASRTSSYVSGTTWYDNSGNGNHGTFYPAVIVPNTSGTTGVAYWSTGVKHFSFNGVDGAYGTGTYMKLPVSNMIDSNGYTFGGWVKSTTSDTSTRILKGADGIYGGWALALSISSTDVWVTLCNAYQQSPSLTATSVVTQNTWYYVICRYNHRSELKLYVNGVAVATLPQATPITNSNEISLRTSPGWVIGAFSTTVTYKSTVSTFHSYNRVLTDSEILQNFNATKSTFGY